MKFKARLLVTVTMMVAVVGQTRLVRPSMARASLPPDNNFWDIAVYKK